MAPNHGYLCSPAHHPHSAGAIPGCVWPWGFRMQELRMSRASPCHLFSQCKIPRPQDPFLLTYFVKLHGENSYRLPPQELCSDKESRLLLPALTAPAQALRVAFGWPQTVFNSDNPSQRPLNAPLVFLS